MKRALILWLLLCGTAHGHAQDPTGILVTELTPRVILVRIVSPTSSIGVTLPADCLPVGPLFACRSSLAGRELGVSGLAPGEPDALYRVQLLGGEPSLGVTRSRIPVPEVARWTRTAQDYLGLGVHHLLVGWDHLLFLLALLLLAPTLRAALLGLTAFTVGHSLTLTASALGWIAFPPALAELAIAGSIVVLALDLVMARRPPGWLAGAMGLLHGLGFATVLAGAGLPRSDVPLALAGFNVGIELAQLGVAALAWPLLGLVRGRERLIGHAIGAIAAMWCLERALALF